MLAWAAGVAFAYIFVQNVRYTLEQTDRDLDAFGKFTKSALTEGTPIHEGIEQSTGPANVVTNVWDVLSGQQTVGEAAKDFAEGELERGKRITGWLGI